MCTNQPALTERLIRALKGLYPTDVVEYLLGVYYLEFGGTYALGGGRYIERKVSFRRARRHLKRALRAKPQDAEFLKNHIIPMKKMGTTQDVADAVVFLCSDMAGHITGMAMPVCGGMQM